MKLALIFPGIGYHADKPLLYYSTRLARSAGFDTRTIQYAPFPDDALGSRERMIECVWQALDAAEAQFGSIDFTQYEELLFISKSIGTARTMELAATGRPVDAQEAKALGLAYKVTTVDELDEVTMAFAKKLAAGPLVSYKNIKKQLYDASYSDYKQWLAETEVPTQRECAASMDFQEGCKAFMEKRKAQFQGK